MSLNFLNAANVDKVDNKEFKTLKCLTSLGISVLSGNEDVDRWNLICNSFVTEDPQLKEEKSLARSLSGYIKRNTPVLITGPTGTGKEILAKIIHGPRPQDKFYAVNCGGLVDNLFESQLFGHVRGAFTGAASDKKGYLQAASGGTLFMDEIGNLPLRQQASLITVLSSYKATPVGSTDEYNVDCNFVFATNKNLLELVRNGLFMLDLYYRIVFTIIHTTSLASRPRDARLIAQAIIRHNGYDPLGEEEVVPITDGNVRTIEIWLYRRSLGLEGEALKRGITE